MMIDGISNARIGGRIHFFPILDSTNIMAHNLALDGAPEGDVVIADAQSKGRGRLKRTWQSPPGRNLYLSLILKPSLDPSKAPQITLMAGLAVAELLSPYCPGQVAIKWPNDILILGKKICGILTEMKSSADGVEFVVLGIGINVNMVREEFDDILQDTATSLKIETGATFDRLTIAGNLFELIEKWYRVLLHDGFKGMRDRFLFYTDMMGKQIRVVFKNDIRTGEAVGMDDDGTILMKDNEGVIQRVTAGDIFIMKG
jgi:BirA family transcriptional regulator, biotin operon repressor / biotin---[acetyl-CoA-carboxylase] ligase